MQLRSSFPVVALILTLLTLRAQETPPAPTAIDPILLRPGLWQLEKASLEPEMRNLGFRWISANQDVARSAAPGLVFHKHSLREAILSFRGGKLAEVKLSYFNRGDSGAVREDQFEELVAGVTADLTELTGRPPVERGRDSSNAVKADGRIWDVAGTRYLLEWSATKGSNVRAIPFRAEFIRLTIRPGAAPPPIGAAPATSRDIVKRFVGRDHVERIGDDVKLKDLPMVDQGEKGYCVVASVERVMRYYGATVDQHELAQIADSDASKGTSTGAMLASLRRLTARLGIKVRSLYEWNVRDFLKMVDDYNRATKRGKLAPEVAIPYRRCRGVLSPGETRYLQGGADEEHRRLRSISARNSAQHRRGSPPALVGAPRHGQGSERSAAAGGHMRIIIGYNKTTNEVLYSDSWGNGHEEKRMPLEGCLDNYERSQQPAAAFLTGCAELTSVSLGAG